MNFMDIQLDQEALDETYSQINYFSNIPKHIKNIVSKYDVLKEDSPTSIKPAHLVNERITVINGKLNMPNCTESNEFALT